MGTVRVEDAVMAPDVHTSCRPIGGNACGWLGLCTCFNAHVNLMQQTQFRQPRLESFLCSYNKTGHVL